MTADEYAAGLLANRRRIETENAFTMAIGYGMTQNDELADDLLPRLGLSAAEVSMQRMRRQLAKQTQAARASHHGFGLR